MASAGTPFSRHAARNRTLLVIAGRLVYKVVLSLTRWRCPKCNKTFTSLPAFMLRHKHYAFPHLLERAGSYACNTELSYRRCVTESSLPIFRWNGDILRPETGEKAQVLARSTVFRWVTDLGGLVPHTKLKVFEGPPDRRGKSPARRSTLIACRQFCSDKDDS
jgi:hypothetical protein